MLHSDSLRETRRGHGSLRHLAPSFPSVHQAPLRPTKLKRQKHPQDTGTGATVHELPLRQRSPLIQDVPAGVKAEGFD